MYDQTILTLIFNRRLMHNKWTDFFILDQQPGLTLISPNTNKVLFSLLLSSKIRFYESVINHVEQVNYPPITQFIQRFALISLSQKLDVAAFQKIFQFSLGTMVQVNAQLRSLKSNSHAPNLHACIIYIRVNILLVCIFAHANANTHGI